MRPARSQQVSIGCTHNITNRFPVLAAGVNICVYIAQCMNALITSLLQDRVSIICLDVVGSVKFTFSQSDREKRTGSLVVDDFDILNHDNYR